MRIADMNWAQVEAYLARDDRAVLPVGSTEQHAGLSLCVDYILSERVSAEAAEPLGVPVYPGLPYGMTPRFMAYPGTVTLAADTYGRLIRDILDSLSAHGFKRIVIVNGHGGNTSVRTAIDDWRAGKAGVAVKFHNWWNAPQTWRAVQAVDPVASHASWMENFPWTRLAGVEYPEHRKPMLDISRLRGMEPTAVRQYLGDGNFGGRYCQSDEVMDAIWQVAVRETRAIIDGGW